MFRFPTTLPKLKCSRPQGLPFFRWDDVERIQFLGSGSYSDVSVYRKKTGEKVAIKTFKNNVKKDLIDKEVLLVGGLEHRNVVKALGFSDVMPNGMMMEYCMFDLKPFTDVNLQVSTLSGLLPILDDCNCEQFQHLQIHAAAGLLHGLSYLHSKGVVHRDLKPDNVLVSNQQYVGLYEVNPAMFLKSWQENPICIKLSDFGEGRSSLIQTSTLLHTATANAYRGSPAFMAPEILIPLYRPERPTETTSIEVMKSSDVWSLSLIFHHLVFPDIRYVNEH